MLERRLTPRPLGRSAKRLDMDVDLALFVLVAFSIYTGCATTNTYRVNMDSKNPSDLVGKYVHIHHDMKEFPSPIEGTVGKFSTESVLVVFTAAQGKLEIPSKQIDRIETVEKRVDKTRTGLAIGVGVLAAVVVAGIVFVVGMLQFYNSFGS